MATKRSIFEEVGSDRPPAPAPQGGMIDAGRGRGRGAVRAWLVLIFILVVAMIAVGGLTRLTDSGLSITEWRPLTGALPPLSEAAWQAEFDKYRQIPEFRLQNAGMDLAAFKQIFWWEWGHRLLGRVIGLVWAAGFAGFVLTRRIPPGWTRRLLLLGLLGGLQGAVGWWMVSSGLDGAAVDVASYRLAVHLGLAFAILGLTFAAILELGRSDPALMQARRQGEPRLAGLATGLLHLAFCQILLGALVAGLDAGRGFTDWPWMGGQFLPPDPFALSPWWRNFFEDPGLVQFVHRVFGYLVLAFAVFAWARGRRSAHPVTARAFALVLAAVLAQVALGIVTVLHGAPLALGLAHQLGAVAVFAIIIRARHLSRMPVIQSIRGARA